MMESTSSLLQIERRIVACERCADLREYCRGIAQQKKRQYAADKYWGKPVPAFGDPAARVMLVGLAPGAHGSNRTGRMFTGDASGAFLYPSLYRSGFASQPNASNRHDGLQLRDCIITAAARCAPPDNKPSPQHLANCLPFLLAEFDALPKLRVAIALGRVGFDSIRKVLKLRGFQFTTTATPRFAHASEYEAKVGGRTITLLASYHPSRQNTNTGVLTENMLDAVFRRATQIVAASRM